MAIFLFSNFLIIEGIGYGIAGDANIELIPSQYWSRWNDLESVDLVFRADGISRNISASRFQSQFRAKI